MASAYDQDYCPSGELHNWQPDPEKRREGLVCDNCGLSEAELAGEDTPS